MSKRGGLLLGDVFPDFKADTSDGPINFHEYIKDSWCIFFSHPADYTPVCTTELARAAKLKPEFEKLGVKMVALSCNDTSTHQGWIKDIVHYGGLNKNEPFPFPIIDDSSRDLAQLLGIFDPDEFDSKKMPLTARAVFIIDPSKKMRLSILYPATTGRNFDEIIRVIKSLQLCDKHRVATPVDWQDGQSCMIQPTVSVEDQQKHFPNAVTKELPSGKGYVRETPQPSL